MVSYLFRFCFADAFDQLEEFGGDLAGAKRSQPVGKFIFDIGNGGLGGLSHCCGTDTTTLPVIFDVSLSAADERCIEGVLEGGQCVAFEIRLSDGPVWMV
jgi:hypothetical protein